MKIRKQARRIFLLIILVFCLAPSPSLAAVHTVAPGETIFLIAQRYQVPPAAVIASNSIANPNLINPGQPLSIPERYTVLPGDTIWKLSVSCGIPTASLAAMNNLSQPHLIYPGQQLLLPSVPSLTPSPSLPSRGGRGFSSAELDLLARLVHSESAGEPYMGQVAVAASVLNRIQSSRYPNTLAAVIYQICDGCYQYSPVQDGRINLPAGSSAYQAVQEAISGWDPSLGATGFYNPNKTTNRWVRQQPVTTVIGNHVFFR